MRTTHAREPNNTRLCETRRRTKKEKKREEKTERMAPQGTLSFINEHSQFFIIKTKTKKNITLIIIINNIVQTCAQLMK